MKECKFFASENLVELGFSSGNKQKYLSKDCKRTGVEGGERKKCSSRFYEIYLILYENGSGFRRIAEILSKIFGKKIYYQTVVKWLKKVHPDLSKKTTEN